MKPIIIIPTYNERQNIERLITAIFNLQIPCLEAIVVDDNSPDGTGDIALQLSQKYPVHLLKRAGKLGLGSAYIKGFKKALSMGADVIFEMDADLSHDPQDIPHLLKAAETADCAIGSRKIAGGKIIGWNSWRHFISNGAMWFSRTILGLKTKDVTSGFRCYRRKVLEQIKFDEIKSNGYAFQEETLYRIQKAGLNIQEIPVTFTDRQNGKSKLSNKDILEFFWVIIKLSFTLK